MSFFFSGCPWGEERECLCFRSELLEAEKWRGLPAFSQGRGSCYQKAQFLFGGVQPGRLFLCFSSAWNGHKKPLVQDGDTEVTSAGSTLLRVRKHMNIQDAGCSTCLPNNALWILCELSRDFWEPACCFCCVLWLFNSSLLSGGGISICVSSVRAVSKSFFRPCLLLAHHLSYKPKA